MKMPKVTLLEWQKKYGTEQACEADILFQGSTLFFWEVFAHTFSIHSKLNT